MPESEHTTRPRGGEGEGPQTTAPFPPSHHILQRATELRPRFLAEGAAAVLQKMGLAVLYVSPLRVFERGEEMQ